MDVLGLGVASVNHRVYAAGVLPTYKWYKIAILLDEFAESGPGILATDEVNGFVLTGMSG